MAIPNSTPIYRLIHLENLPVTLARQALHAPNHNPKDGLAYKTIHSEEVQAKRRSIVIPCGPKGTVHDYVSFYFGYLSPMLLQLKTGQVAGYDQGQDPLIYLVSTAQAVQAHGEAFVFSDGHGVARFTAWFDDLADLGNVDWSMVYQRYWADTAEDMDRQRRKQAEFLVYKTLPWDLIQEIGVVNAVAKAKVEAILVNSPVELHRPVLIRPDWYYA